MACMSATSVKSVGAEPDIEIVPKLPYLFCDKMELVLLEPVIL